jgi:hypothetical protein
MSLLRRSADQKATSLGISSCATASAWIAPVDVPTAMSILIPRFTTSSSNTPTWNAPFAPPPLSTTASSPGMVVLLCRAGPMALTPAAAGAISPQPLVGQGRDDPHCRHGHNDQQQRHGEHPGPHVPVVRR